MSGHRFATVLAILLFSSIHACASSSLGWDYFLGAGGDEVQIGTRPGYADGYDGQTPINPSAGLHIFLHRDEGAGWSAGFYNWDYESPIPDGGSKTWWDLYLWATDSAYLTTEDRAPFWAMPDLSRPPTGYWGQLVLDYVPDGLNWSGPWSFTWDLNQGFSYLLPVPITDNPYDPDQVTRMHLTVYTSPIPEPSSLLALAGGLAGLAIGAMRRRR